MKVLNPDSIRWYIDPLTGLKLPSVTSVLQLAPEEPFLEKWRNSMTVEEYLAYMDKVFERGTIIHKLCEDYFNGTHSQIPLNPEYQCYINGFHRFIAMYASNITPYFTEETMACSDLGIAWTADFLCEWEWKFTLIDWKTSSSARVTGLMLEKYRMQTAMYVKIFEYTRGRTVEQAVVVPLTAANKNWLWKHEVMNAIQIEEYWQKAKGYILDMNLIYNNGYLPPIFSL